MRVPSALGLIAFVFLVGVKAQPSNSSGILYAPEPDEFGNPIIIYREPEASNTESVMLAQDILMAATATGTCTWKANNVGFKCYWSKSATEQPSLKLKDDCAVTAPIPKDNYVGDKRTNKLGPAITIKTFKSGTSAALTTESTTWLDYATSPGTLENMITFNEFGTFDLKMIATDYRASGECNGCVAIIDTFRPKSQAGCSTTDTETSLDYSTTNLNTAIEKEDAFSAFYANVINNGAHDLTTGDNERDDLKTAKMTDFFDTEKDLPSIDSRCFGSTFLKSLLDKRPIQLPSGPGAAQTELNGLVCKRCCNKHRELREYYYLYDCDKVKEKKKGCGDKCSYSQCLTVQPKDLILAKAEVSGDAQTLTTTVIAGLPTPPANDPKTIHQSITCKNFNEGCKYTPKLKDLFTHGAEWNNPAEVPGYTVDNYVYWRYTVDTVDWKVWDDEDVLTFDKEDGRVSIEAWSSCGLVFQDSFDIKLHPHTTHDACAGWKWTENALSPRTVESYMCAYPKSDFALLTFSYDSDLSQSHQTSTVKGKYTDVKCYVKLAESGGIASVAKASLPLTVTPDAATSRIQLSKQLALELVHDPTTSKNTDVELTCDFTYSFFNSPNTVNEPCTSTFTITDCDVPEIETSGAEAVCRAGQCLDPASSGPYEACNGNVFTTVSSGSTLTTQAKSLSGQCCTDCAKTLTCKSVPESSATGGVQRCEPPPALVMAMAMEEAGEMKSAQTSTAVAAGVSAMMALVALVVVKQRMAQAAKPAVDDAYVSLLD